MKTETASPVLPTPPVAAAGEIVTLLEPVRRGETLIAEVTVRKPRSGELRGLSLAELCRLEVNQLQQLLPRITQPMLHRQDIDNLDPADLIALGSAVISFLLPTEVAAASLPA